MRVILIENYLRNSTGLQYLRARYYSTRQGRFISEDPFPGLLTQPASLTPYVYALNNPVRYTDPSGEFIDTLFDIASVGYDIYSIADKYNRGCSVAWTDWASLGMDALSLALPFVPAAGMVVRFAAHADDVGDIARLAGKSSDAIDLIMKMESVRDIGRTGEKLAEITKNTEHIISLSGTAKYRIPDELDHIQGVIREVKNVKRLDYTNQIRDFVAYSTKLGYELDLLVRETTLLSNSLSKIIEKGDIILKRILP